jgi:mRNA-degrading endonuclease RelE of RelBE toxin-antitoxin system
MRESMEILSDPEMAARVRAGRRAVATADVVGLEELSGGFPPTPGPWRVVLTGPVARQLEEWGEPAATEVRQMLVTLAAGPAEQGHALGMGLVGVWSAHGTAHRILYAIQEGERLVTVLTVDDRG